MAESTEMKVVVSLVDQISGKLKATQSKLAGFSDTTRKVGAGFTAMGGVMVGVLGASVAAAGDAAKSQTQLEHATLNVAHGTREQLTALEEVSAELQKKGVLDGDNIKIGQAQLMTFGLTADMVAKLSPSLADLAVNQFGVNATGEDMTSTANMIAKALNGQFGVLEKSGIRFTEAQQKMVQFGTESEKAAALQEGFAQNLKYTNEVAATTLEGGVAKLKVSLGDLVEQIGGALLPVIMELVKKIQPVLERVMNWISNNEELVGKVVLVAAAIGGLMVVLGPLLIALSFLPALIGGVGVAFAIATSPITLIALGIAAVVAGGILLVKNWDTVKQAAKDLANSIGQAFAGFASTAKSWVDDVINSVNGAIDSLKQKFWEIPQALADAFSYGVGRVKDMLLSIDIPGIPGFANGVRNFGGGLAVVGEHGRELVNLPRGSDVIPNRQTERMLSGGSTTNDNTKIFNTTINMQSGESPDEVLSRFGVMLKLST